ncbi:hypothetical protein M2351_003625 [Azospirillum canadense]|nr:hypothetical protein [Azospirillum canadense]
MILDENRSPDRSPAPSGRALWTDDLLHLLGAAHECLAGTAVPDLDAEIDPALAYCCAG